MKALPKNVIVVRYRKRSDVAGVAELRFWNGSLWVGEWTDALQMAETDARACRSNFRCGTPRTLSDEFEAIEDYGLTSERTLP